jgi:hypothetical protein
MVSIVAAMAREASIPKAAVIYGVSLPLAVLLGYLLAQPMSLKSIAVVGGVLGVLLLPLLVQWHHALLVIGWNAAITPYFLPGQPDLWMLMTAASLPLTLLARALDRNRRLDFPPSLAIPLLLLAAVTLATAFATGGLGFRSLGGTTYGGRRYLTILLAIAGFFALAWGRVPREHRRWYAGLFFVSAGTALVSDFAYLLGPRFYFLFNVFSVGEASTQIFSDMSQQPDTIARFGGVSVGATGGLFFMLLWWGIRGLMDFTRPWRAALFLAVFALGLMGGFRSLIVTVGLVFAFQFCFEGLHRTRFLFWLLAAVVGLGLLLLPVMDRLPLAAQRTLSIVPGAPVSQAVKDDARISSDWRVEMWRVLVPEVPQYLWKGKGYAMNPTDYYLAQAAAARGIMKDYEPYLISGEYHSGILTLIIPLGIWGTLAFLAFLAAGARILYWNHRYGDADLRAVNTFMLAFFLAKTVYYFVVFGSFYSELRVFTGVVGFSLCLNHGICRPPVRGTTETPAQTVPPRVAAGAAA